MPVTVVSSPPALPPPFTRWPAAPLLSLATELHSVFGMLEHPESMLQPLPADHPRVVVLRGAGRAFCGGVDIKAADQGIGGAAWEYK